MNILCIKHVGFEGPAAIALWAQTRGHELTIAASYQGSPLPSPETFDALVVMGGPMNIYEDNKYPWLIKEKAYIRSAIAAGKHVLGVCLGAQLIAHALGAQVTQAEHKEIGWFPIARSESCPAAIPLEENLQVLHWHGDTFALPEGAQCLAQSEACQNQVFLYRSRVLALQCHLELTPEGLALLSTACSHELVEGRYIQDLERLTCEPNETYSTMHDCLFGLLDFWSNN